jgi:8-oxo-dGTP pyrophosphatase MutT (NUDIX family)
MENPWKKLSSKTEYDSPWIRTEEHQVINPSGKQSIYSKVHFKNLAVAIIPLDDDYNTWIVGQFRYPTQTYEWEVCEGGCPEGTAPLDTARRELMEECGITAMHFELILEMQLSNAATDEVSYSYVAKGLSFGESEPEETEQLTIKKIPFQQLFEMTMRGEIRDGLSVATILKTKLLIDAGKL